MYERTAVENIYRHMYRHAYIHTDTHTDTYTYIHTDTHTYIHTNSHTYIDTPSRMDELLIRLNVRTLTTKLISVHPARAVMRPMPTDVAA